MQATRPVRAYPSNSTRICAVSDCGRFVHARDLCRTHYRRYMKTGATDLSTDLDRFNKSYVVAPNGCWEWTGALRSQGYGSFWFDGTWGYAHRFAVIHIKGEVIPDGMHTDHLCRNRKCCNPDHLEVVTPRENMDRGELAQRHAEWAQSITHCPQGHEYDQANTRVDRRGRRSCRACDRAYQQRRRRERSNA